MQPNNGQQMPNQQQPVPNQAAGNTATPTPQAPLQPLQMARPGSGTPAPTPQAPQPQAAAAKAPIPQGNPNSTQNALLISEIRDNMVIMNDGTMRAVVACRSINFDLMSERERESVEYAYQQFINSLYFPV